MASRTPCFSVPNAVGVPRPSDIALFLCGRAIAAEWHKVSTTSAAAVEALAAWYLRQVTQMQEHQKRGGQEIPKPGITEESHASETRYSQSSETNFSDAFEALGRPRSETDARVKQKLDEEVYWCGRGLPRALSDEVIGETGLLLYGNDIMHVVEDARGSFRFFEELLDICLQFGGAIDYNSFIYHIVCFYIDNSTSSSRTSRTFWGTKTIEERAAIILSELPKLFNVCDDVGTQNAAGSVTHSFNVWLGVSWNCASFSWQAHVARVTGCLLAKLEERKNPARREVGVKSSSRAFCESTSDKRLNIALMHSEMRRICEGCNSDSKGLLEILVESGPGAALPLRDHNNVLEYIFSEQAYGGAGGAQDSQQQRHQSILSNIMNSVLLYSQFYISVRSLEAALRCAQMGVLVGHHWRSSELLTIAHYCSFIAHVACQDTPAAAGDVAIMLQLADAATRRDGNLETGIHAPRFHAGCLGYMGAALLLLISPGTVDTSLRSVIITGIVAGVRLTSNAAGGSAGTRAGGSSGDNSSFNGLLYTATEAATSGGSVVVQTTAQTVRHALWLSEMEAFLDPSSTVSTEVLTTITRETLLLIAGQYGVCSFVKPIDSASLGRSLGLMRDSVVEFSSDVSEPSESLLRETMRLTAHHVLAVQVGAVEAPSGWGPFRILQAYLTAVEEHYGADGLATVEQNFFFLSTYRFLCAMWLRACGYMKSAYQELTRLAEGMLFYSRCGNESRNEDGVTLTATISKSSNQSAVSAGTSFLSAGEPQLRENSVRAGESNVGKEERLQYWPPDHLLLWQHVQFERAQLAHYLGYSCVIPEISEALRRVSAASHFVMGVLYADLVASMTWTQRKNYFGALQVLEKVESNAESIGLTLVRTHARMRQVSILIACNRWQEALEKLYTMQPVPAIFQYWYLLTRLQAKSEALMTCSEATMQDLAAVVNQHIKEMEECGCFGDATQLEDSASITLLDRLCIYACIGRHAVTSSERRPSSWEESVNQLAQTLQRRQLQEGKWQLLWNMPMRDVCNGVLSMTLLEKVLNAC